MSAVPRRQSTPLQETAPLARPERYALSPNEWIYVDCANPLVEMENYAIVAMVEIGPEQILIIDPRRAPTAANGQRLPFCDGTKAFDGDLILAHRRYDESELHDENAEPVWAGEWLRVGTEQTDCLVEEDNEDFEPEHFAVGLATEGARWACIRNLEHDTPTHVWCYSPLVAEAGDEF